MAIRPNTLTWRRSFSPASPVSSAHRLLVGRRRLGLRRRRLVRSGAGGSKAAAQGRRSQPPPPGSHQDTGESPRTPFAHPIERAEGQDGDRGKRGLAAQQPGIAHAHRPTTAVRIAMISPVSKTRMNSSIPLAVHSDMRPRSGNGGRLARPNDPLLDRIRPDGFRPPCRDTVPTLESADHKQRSGI